MHLEPRHAQMVMEILEKHVPGYDVWLFGSRAHGRSLRKASDIDLCIKTQGEPLPPTLYSKIVAAFEDSDLPFFVDVVDWAATAPHFQKIIEQQYEVIWNGHTSGVKS